MLNRSILNYISRSPRNLRGWNCPDILPNVPRWDLFKNIIIIFLFSLPGRVRAWTFAPTGDCEFTFGELRFAPVRISDLPSVNSASLRLGFRISDSSSVSSALLRFGFRISDLPSVNSASLRFGFWSRWQSGADFELLSPDSWLPYRSGPLSSTN